jgi:hypothetical protein
MVMLNPGPPHQPQPAAAFVGAKATTAIANAPKAQAKCFLIGLSPIANQAGLSLPPSACDRINLVSALQ